MLLEINVKSCGLRMIYFVFGQVKIYKGNTAEISSDLMVGNNNYPFELKISSGLV